MYLEKVGVKVSRVYFKKKSFSKPHRTYFMHYKMASKGIIPGIDVINEPLTLIVVQIVVVLAVCKLFSLVGQHFHQPRVVFETIGGIFLGPSVLGKSDHYYRTLFPGQSLSVLELLSNVGLLLYMYVVGLELDLARLKTNGIQTACIAVSGLAVPFALGIALSSLLWTELQDSHSSLTSFTTFFMFIATAMSSTASPILARILKESGLVYTQAGTCAMGAGVINGAIAWFLLVLSVALSKNQDMLSLGWLLFALLSYALLIYIPINRMLTDCILKVEESYSSTKADDHLLTLCFVLVFLSAWLLSLLGMHPIIGSFMIGIILPRNSRVYRNSLVFMERFLVTFFLPLFFASSGLRTDFTTIRLFPDVPIVVMVCAVAFVAKVIGAGVPAYLFGFSVQESVAVGALMNARGVVELVVLNTGLQTGILSARTFSVMVIMCIVTTVLVTPVYPEHTRKYFETTAVDTSSAGCRGSTTAELELTALSPLEHSMCPFEQSNHTNQAQRVKKGNKPVHVTSTSPITLVSSSSILINLRPGGREV